MVKVHNLNGTSNSTPSDGSSSWKEFWENQTGRDFSYCSASDCTNWAEVGAHVQKSGAGTSNEWYIVPLCSRCNQRTGDFYVNSNDLVRENES